MREWGREWVSEWLSEWLTEWVTECLSERSKKVLKFFWNFAHLKFTIDKYAEFSSFGETTFLWEWNSISSFKVGKNFTKDFPVIFFFPGESFVKWTHIRITGNSFVKFSVWGSWSIIREFLIKIQEKQFYKWFPCKKKLYGNFIEVRSIIFEFWWNKFFMGKKFNFEF